MTVHSAAVSRKLRPSDSASEVVERTCLGCGNPFSVAARQTGRPRRYCANLCRDRAYRASRRKPLPPRYAIEDRGHDTPCWIWLGYVDEYGYGRVGGTRAHARVYVEHRGPIPDGLVLDHLCRVPACVNPDHLEPVTQTENVRRGRATKLSFADVAAIRASDESKHTLARRYGVSAGYIYVLRRGTYLPIGMRQAA